jgi:nicotinate phosphoribosyltransferase
VTETSALLTDLYQLTMLQAYFDRGMNETAVFEFFVRRMPEGRSFLIAAGLDQVLDYLETLRFTDAELTWLERCDRFHPRFLASLSDLRFTGDVAAMPEGTPFFANEPILRVIAPLREAQFVETRLINLLQFQTMIASKAARIRLVAPHQLLVDFGLRRAHGAEAGLLSSRASFLAGFDGTSNVLAAMRWNIPMFGTMAHSFIQTHTDESAAFEHFARSHPNANTLLIDTYDTEVAAQALIPLSKRLAAEGIDIQAIRIDSGDLAEHARKVRAILDAGGLNRISIFASGNLDEYAIANLNAKYAPINGFGVGTRMNTSADRPYLDCVYKLQEYAGIPRRKRSEGKATWPGRKQVFRAFDSNGLMAGDTLTIENDLQPGLPLLSPVMIAGARLAPPDALQTARAEAIAGLNSLPVIHHCLNPTTSYPVTVAPALEALAASVDANAR